MKKYLFLIIVATTFALGGIVNHLYYRTDDLSVRYVLWKNGVYPYYSGIPRSVIADRKRDDLIREKTVEQVKAVFHDAHAGSANDYQAYYEKADLKNREHLWLGDTEIVVLFSNGIAQEITVAKG